MIRTSLGPRGMDKMVCLLLDVLLMNEASNRLAFVSLVDYRIRPAVCDFK